MAIGIVLIVLAILELLLGLRFIFRYQKGSTSLFFGLFCIGASVYVGANGLGYITNNTFIGDRIGWAGGALAATFFLPFSFVFPVPKKSLSELLPWVFWPVVIFFLGTLFTDLFLATLSGDFRSGYQTATGRYFWIYLLFFFGYWAWAIVNLVKNYLGSDGVHRWQIRMILVGIAISLIVSSVFDIAIPLFTVSHFGYMGSLMTSAWLGFTSYILLES